MIHQINGHPKRTNPVDSQVEINKQLRYKALLNKGQRYQDISLPMLLSDFMSYGKQVALEKGLRLVDFEMKQVGKGVYYVGLWEKVAGSSIFTPSLSVVEFDKLYSRNKQKGFRLADFELIKKRGQLQVVSLWVKGQHQEQFSPRMTATALKQRNAVLKQQGIYLVDIEVRQEGGQILFDALWRKASGNGINSVAARSGQNLLIAKPTQFMSPITIDQCRTYKKQLLARGQEVIDIERFKRNGKEFITAIWSSGKGPSGFSKSRGLSQFTGYLKSKPGLAVDDLEIHVKNK